MDAACCCIHNDFLPMQPFRRSLLHRCNNLVSPWSGRGAGSEITTRPIFPRIDRGLLPRCNALRLLAPYLSPARGEGTVAADDYASLIDPTCLLHPTCILPSTFCPNGRGRPLPLLGAPSPWMLGYPTVFLSNP
jgi:hypothetical protein